MARTPKTIDELTDADIRTLNGDGVPSPMGFKAPDLRVGDLLNDVKGRLAGDGMTLTAAGRLDATGLATGVAGIDLTDGLASAFNVKEAANSFLTFDTRNARERVSLGKLLTLPVQVLDMADAQVKLVNSAEPGAGEVALTGQILFVDANSSATEDLLLPPEAESTGLVLFFVNTGGEDVVVKEDSDTTTILTLSTTECAFAVCDGTSWKGGVVTLT